MLSVTGNNEEVIRRRSSTAVYEPHHAASMVKIKNPPKDLKPSYTEIEIQEVGNTDGIPSHDRRGPLARWWYGPQDQPRSLLRRALYVLFAAALVMTMVIIMYDLSFSYLDFINSSLTVFTCTSGTATKEFAQDQ